MVCDPAVANIVWSQTLASDPVSSTQGSGVRRARQSTVWSWTTAMAWKT